MAIFTESADNHNHEMLHGARTTAFIVIFPCLYKSNQLCFNISYTKKKIETLLLVEIFAINHFKTCIIPSIFLYISLKYAKQIKYLLSPIRNIYFIKVHCIKKLRNSILILIT